MSGSGTKTQSVTNQTNQLQPSVQNSLNTAQGAATNLYNGGQLYKPYTGSTVVPYSGQTQLGMDGIRDNSNMYFPTLRAGYEQINGLAQGGGFNETQQSALGSLQGIANGSNKITNADQYQAMWDRSDWLSNAEQNLGNFASGKYLDGSNNPYFSQVVDRAAEAARDAVNMNSSGAGRYGSGANQQLLAREVGDLTNRAYSGQYQNEVANMFGANSAMDQQRLANLGVKGQAAAGLSGIQGQNIANQRAAAGDMFNAGQQGYANKMGALQALPAAFQGSLSPFQSMMGVGAMGEDLNSRQMNDQMRMWQEQQSQPRQSAEWLNAMATGAGSLGASNTQTIQTPRTSPFMAGLGGAIGGSTAFGPVGGLIGGGAGLLGSMF